MSTPWLRRFALDRPEARAWVLYDWANSAFWTTVVTAVFPVYFLELAGELGKERATERFTQATTLALVVSALIAPVLGSLADFRALKKTMLGAFALLGSLATAALFFALPGDWLFALVCFALGNVGAAASTAFYDALLPHVAREGEMDRLSSSGFAVGYLGGGLCLALNLAVILCPQWFGLPHGDGLTPAQATLPVRVALLTVGLWWLVFTLPLMLRVKEPPRLLESDERVGAAALKVSFQRLGETLKELRRYRQAFTLLIAALIFNDGIQTVLRMAGLYAAAKELDRTVVVGTFLVVQFVGIPCAFGFGALAERFGTKRMVVIGLATFCLISVLAYYMSATWHFVVLGLLVALVQGGTQALTRSLFASVIPVHKSGEFFAFYGIGEKFAGILGPLVFGLVIGWTGSMQSAILSVIPFFVVGALLLLRVDVAEGRRVAREAEADVRAV
ncbi:MAG: MFS transporter [Planctomycetes bacterium]|nr:MFS transporter [Planctomycetota bacterium]